MAPGEQATRIENTAAELVGMLGTARQMSPLSSRYPDFDFAQAYAIAERVCTARKARGEAPVGRKIGFTNRSIWAGAGIAAPIWGYMYDSTVHDLAGVGGTFDLSNLPEPRIEPEIVLHLARAPSPDMDEAALLECIDWVAHGFEVVYSIYPGWKLTAADAAAACGVHAALLLGDKRAISADRASWGKALAGFSVDLVCDDGTRVQGQGSNVLGGPVSSLRFLVQELARYPVCAPVSAGEVITTGTLTDALPAKSGQTWHTELRGIDMGGIRVRFK